MTPLTREWVEKAEGDYNSAWLLYRARRTPNYDGACFHAQQCAEKYIKARLQEANISFPKTHDLAELLNLAITVEPLWEALRPGATLLSRLAVEVRYPGRSVGKPEAKEAIAICRELRRIIRGSLGLPVI